MARGYHDLFKKQHKFGAQDEIQRARVKGRNTDLKELEISVRSILVSIGKPCRVSEFEKEYKQFIGKKFPVSELGLSSSVEVLKKISEACEILEQSQSDPLVCVKTTQKNAHIFNLVKKSRKPSKPKTEQKSSLLKDLFIPFSVQDGIRCLLYGKRIIKKNDFYKMLEDRFDMKFMNLDVPIEKLVRNLPHLLHSDGVFVKSAHKIQKSEIEIPERFHVEGEHIIPSYRLGYMEMQISKNLCALLAEKKAMQVIHVPSYYFKKFGKELNWKLFGFQDLWRLLQLLPGDFRLIKVASGYVVSGPDANVSDDAIDVREFDEENVCGNIVYEQVLQKIKRLVLHVSTGLNAKHLKSAYETMYYEKLVIRNDPYEFLRKLHEMNIFNMKKIGEIIMLFPCDGYEIEQKRLFQEKAEILDLFKNSMNVMKPGDSLKNMNFKEELNANNQQICAACVSFIETPNNFYIRIAGVDENCELQIKKEFISLNREMQECYRDCFEEYNIPLSELKMDMVCAACVRGEWQRATVLDIVNSAYILINSVDYGVNHKVLLTNLKYLPSKFSKLPILAYRATLFNIQSSGEDWSLEAILDFRKLTAHFGVYPKELSVLIVRRNKKGLLYVALTDECLNDERHVGDALVDLGHAAFRFENETLSTFYS